LKKVSTVKIRGFEQKARDALVECVQDVPFLKVDPDAAEPKADETRPDIRIALQLNGDPKYIIAEAKNNGEPRYARQAANQLLRYSRAFPNEYGVFIAPYISPRSAAICREANIGYVDLAGNCHLSFGQIYVHKEGRPNPFTRRRYLRSLYSPKAERVLRVLLTSGPKEWKVEELANKADVSLGLVSNVKKKLDDQEWIAAESIGFALTDPFALLEEWAQNYNYRRNQVQEFYAMQSVSDFEYELGQVCQREGISYGLTGLSGAARFAPVVRYQRAMAYVDEDLQHLTSRLGIKPVSSGSNVTLLSPYDEGVFYASEELDGSLVVSPVQVYLDLMSYRGRGQEAAEAVRDRVIEAIW
jgi:hypothetical protein